MSHDLFFSRCNRSWARGPAPLWKGDDIKTTTGAGKFIMHGLAVATGVGLSIIASSCTLTTRRRYLAIQNGKQT